MVAAASFAVNPGEMLRSADPLAFGAALVALAVLRFAGACLAAVFFAAADFATGFVDFFAFFVIATTLLFTKMFAPASLPQV